MKKQAMSQEAEPKQAIIDNILVHCCEQERESTAAIHNFVHALHFARLSFQHAESALQGVVKCYCPARTMSDAKHLHGKHLEDVFERRVRVIKRQVASAKVSIIVDESPDITGMPTVNTLFSYFNSETNNKGAHLSDVSHVNACSNVILSRVFSSGLERYGKWCKDVQQ